METSFFDREAGQFVCDFVERLPTTGTGRPFVLYDWQSRVITEFYGQMAVDEDGAPFRQYQYLYLEIPKKNGKSELAAALGVYHLFADGELNAEVYVVAADKDNAGIVFGAAQYMLESAPFTAKMLARGELKIIESQKKIVYRQKRRMGNGNKKWVTVGQMKVLSSEAFSKHGYKPSCVIFDELHAQPNRDLWDVMTFGAGDARRQPVWIVLTTAGDDPDRTSIGWEIHEKAVAIRDARALKNVLAKGGDPRTVLSLRHCEDETLPGKMTELLEQDNPVWLPILYGLTALFGDDPDDLEKIDIWDEALWQMVNPSLGHHLKLRALRVEAKDARRFEANEKLFRWLRLNQWISVKAVSWLPLSLYDKCQWNGDPDALLGKVCYGGVDLSSTTDLTAFVLLFPIQPGLDKAVTLFRAWRPGLDVLAAEKRDHVPYRDWARAGFLTLSEGNLVDYEDVIAAITDAMARYQLKMVGFDPYLSRTITARLTAAGVPNIEIPQDLKNMSPAMKEIQEGMLRRELLHIHNTCGRWCFGNVRNYVDGNGNMKPLKDKSTGRIDITVAWIIVVAVWMIVRNQPA
ncbi:MAG: terminase TerL endonuclease subunit, partial [Oscillospiraceae bacterium]